jgi:flagellar protein FlaJ
VSLPYLLGSRVLRLAGERLRPFQEIYYTAGFSEVYEAYLGKWLMAYILATPLVASLSLALHQSLGFPLPVSVVLTLIVLFAYSLVFLAACLYYPVYRRHSRGWTITARLPYTLAYFAVLASSGLGFTEILRMVRELEENKEIRREVDLLLTDVELLGVDVLSALERAAARSPSAALSLFLSGLRDAYLTGGNLYSYTSFTTQRLLEMKRSELQRVTNTVAAISEMYVTLMVAAPLMFIVMLAIISMLGGTVGGLPANLLIAVLVMIGTPSFAAATLVMLDAALSRV